MSTNEINGLPRPRPPDAGEAKAGKAAAGKTAPAPAPAPGTGAGAPPAPADTVRFSDASARLQRLEAALADMPAVDRARVEALKRDIQSGAYRVDPERVAEKLLDLERSLLGR
jgi:negative regulator of flagellin synthesis FlgM